MNSRRRVAFLLAIAMILVSLPFSGGITTYASALSEEDGTIIINESTGEMLVTDDDLKDGQMAESEEDIADINDDFLIISDEDTTPLLEADDGCEDGKLFESNEDIEGVNEEIPSDKLWGDSEAWCYVSVVGQKFPFYYYGQPNISEGLENLEMTRIPGSASSYFKGKKAGLTTFTWYIEDTTHILGFRFLDISEVHPQSCEVEHASSPMGFDDIVEFYFCGRFRGIYYELENPEHYLYSLSPILFKIKDLSTQEVFYIGENYEDTNYALNNSFVPNVSNYEVSAIFPNIMYDPDRDEPFYQVKGPEGSAMKLKIDSVGGGKQRIISNQVKSLTISPKFIPLKPDYECEGVPGSRALVSVEISPKDADVDYVYWDSEFSANVCPEYDETPTFIQNGKLYANNWIYASNAEGYDKITVSTEDGKFYDEAIVYVSSDGSFKPVTDLSLNKTNLTLVIGKNETEVLKATIQPSNATDKNVEWKSDNPNIVRVDSKGKVTAVSVGTATVSASTAQGFIKTTCEVTVKEVEQHRINQTIVVGGRRTDERLAKTKNDGNDYSITYSDRGIVSISNQGVIRGQRAGHVSAKVIKADVVYTLEIDVINPITGANSYSKNTGDKFSLGFNAGGLPVTYSSGKPDIASIDSNGNITAKAKGKTTITALVQEKKFTVNVTVYDPQISGDDALYLDGKTITLRVINGNGKTQWSSSDEGIATVDNKGKVKGVSDGKVTITAINNERVLRKEIDVYRVPGFAEKRYNINDGETLGGIFDDADIGNIIYSSANPSIASVDSNGRVTGVKKGSARITAECGGKKYTTTVNVYSPVITAGSEALMLLDNKALNLSVKNGNGKTQWTSSNETVATVSNGRVKALAKGVAVITAENNGRKMDCTVRVCNVPRFDQKQYNVNIGDSVEVAITKDDDLTGVEYSVSNSKVAVIDNNGVVTGLKKGSVTVTAKIAGKKYTTKVTVL